jgi:aminoglycoside phosphotransferase (APT) family kinase protein
VDVEEWSAGVLGEHVPPLSRASGSEVYAGTGLVLKVHAPGTDAAALDHRLRAAALLAPLLTPARPCHLAAPDGRLATLWPRVAVLDPDAPPAPARWRRLGALLARLHGAPAAALPGLPPARPARRLARAVSRLAERGAAEQVVRGQADRLLGLPLGAGTAVVHGDWHLGQVGWRPAGPVLLDVDELGAGDPAWDLARPAGFWAAGLLADAAWEAFLGGYREAGGTGVPATGDPWGRLDRPARWAVLVAAANALTGHLACSEEERTALIEACRDMSRSTP